jgi:uncharacterized membrane protein YqjE
VDHNRQDARDSRSIGDITGDLLENAQELFRDEIRLAKVEIREDLKTAGRAAAILVTGILMALFAFGMLLFTATWALDTLLPLWAAAGIVTVVVAVLAAVLITVGRSRVSEVNPKPERTVESMKENVQWIKQQTR